MIGRADHPFAKRRRVFPPRDGRAFRMLVVIDESSRACLAILVARRLCRDDVLALLAELFVVHGPPGHIRSDNGPEFCAKAVRTWLARLEVGTLFIEPGSPWENGYCESFNSKLRDEFLNLGIFYPLKEAEVLSEQGRRHDNRLRPHSSLGYRPPAPETIVPASAGLATLRSASPPEAASVSLH
jgi:putative transposase